MMLCVNLEFPNLFSSCRYLVDFMPIVCIRLITVFVHPSMVEMLDAGMLLNVSLLCKDNICYFLDWYDWMDQYRIDSLYVLPASFGPQDAFKIVSLCSSVQLALKGVYDRMEKEMEYFSVSKSSGILLSDDSQLVNIAKDKLDDSAYKILTDYQTATVTLLALISAATGDEEDCSSDRILTKRELLENQMLVLKGLVLNTS
ncbi:protein gle1 [Fagus crenata]